MTKLHLRIWDQLYEQKILPHCASRHALSLSIPARESVDINTALFETAGRIASGILWKLWMEPSGPSQLSSFGDAAPELEEAVQLLSAMPHNNPAMFVPASEDQATDILLVLLALCAIPSTRVNAISWLRQMANASMLAYRQHLRYPITTSEYAVHLRHPAESDDNYRKAHTQASAYWPLLALFAKALGDDELVNVLHQFQDQELSHCNFQIWVPNARTEDKIWNSLEQNGSSVGSLVIGERGEPLLKAVRKEVEENPHYSKLSTTRLNHWPLLLQACRLHKLPPPPQLWMPLLEELMADDPAVSTNPGNN